VLYHVSERVREWVRANAQERQRDDFLHAEVDEAAVPAAEDRY